MASSDVFDPKKQQEIMFFLKYHMQFEKKMLSALSQPKQLVTTWC